MYVRCGFRACFFRFGDAHVISANCWPRGRSCIPSSSFYQLVMYGDANKLVCPANSAQRFLQPFILQIAWLRQMEPKVLYLTLVAHQRHGLPTLLTNLTACDSFVSSYTFCKDVMHFQSWMIPGQSVFMDVCAWRFMDVNGCLRLCHVMSLSLQSTGKIGWVFSKMQLHATAILWKILRRLI